LFSLKQNTTSTRRFFRKSSLCLSDARCFINELVVQGKFSRINFREDFYVGGYSNYSLIGERSGVSGGLVGCVRRVDVNGKQYDMRRGAFIGDALRGFDVGQSVELSLCLSFCLS